MEMNKKKYKAKERLIIVLEGIKGNVSLGELCNQYGISQQTYYNWRDRLLSEGSKIFSYGVVDSEKEVLKQEVSRLKETVGELTMELKKNDW